MTYYVDSSALLKFSFVESNSEALDAWCRESNAELVISDLVRTEALRAARRIAPQRLETIRRDLDVLPCIRLTPMMFLEAGNVNPVSLRSLDAIHVAAALSLGPALEGFVTYDDRLRGACEVHGIRVVAPA